MSTIELRKRLIEKIQITENEKLLEEVYRLLELETDDVDSYMLNDSQKEAIDEARQQISEGKYLSNEQANREIDEWLSK